jgi:hypothetical protein
VPQPRKFSEREIMSEQDKPFVVNDRRKFRMDGELREPHPEEASQAASVASSEPAAEADKEASAAGSGPVLVNAAHTVTPVPEPVEEVSAEVSEDGQPDLPAPPTPEEIEQVRAAYDQTAERLDTMIRSQNLGGEHLPAMDFTQVVQSIYMSAMMQLGAGTQQGQQPRVDILGAIEAKCQGNLADTEQRLIDAALFELRMGFLEITQMLARQAAAKQPPPPGGPTGAGGGLGGGFTGGGPRIVR